MYTVTLAELVRTYIAAKDTNRPHLVPKVFARTATVEMTVKTLPPTTSGLPFENRRRLS